MSNRLAQSLSPYLQQHKDNPVDWFPWTEEALAKAKNEGKPIFLSIGYSSCHWCHVMERESFSNVEIAEILNSQFVPIKVDREERPDLDHIYMTAVQMMTGQGGWPLNVFLTADLRPFFGGTYFAPDARYGQPPFRELLLKISDVHQNQPDLVRKNADQLTALIVQHSQYFTASESMNSKLLDAILENLKKSYDPEHGGLGGAPKFFHVDGLRYLLRQSVEQSEPALQKMVEHSFSRMLCGGVYDHVGGGFHRYSTDAAWQIPHFEKMLYDNALLAMGLIETWKVTKNPVFREVAEETLDWVLRDMRSPAGTFYSAIDADSEHKEGEFYAFSFEELQKLVPSEDQPDFFSRYNISRTANFEGRLILHLSDPISSDERKRFRPILENLRKVRSKRVWPLIDRKILTSWNGLMISAMAKVGFATGEERFLNAARMAADNLLENMFDGNALYHSSFEGTVNRVSFLEDYAYFAEALLDLFEATCEPNYFQSAERLSEVLLSTFYDSEQGGFWSTGVRQMDLLVRYKEIHDGALPSPYHLALAVLHRLHELTGEARWFEALNSSILAILGSALESPGGFHRFALVLEEVLKKSKTLIVTSPTKEMVQTVRETYFPLSRSFLMTKSDSKLEKIPAFQGKWSNQSQVFECQAGSCDSPRSNLNAGRGA